MTDLRNILSQRKASDEIARLDREGELDRLFPELAECRDVEQPRYHHLDVRGHSVLAAQELDGVLILNRGLEFTDTQRFLMRFAALIHDVAKPRTAEFDERRRRTMFKRHDKAGAEMAESICRRFGLTEQETEAVIILVKMHMRVHHMATMHDQGTLTKRATRKFLRDAGDNLEMLLMLGQADGRAARGELKPKNSGLAVDLNLQDYLFDFMEG